MRLKFEQDITVNDLELEFSTRSDVEGVGDHLGDAEGQVSGGGSE